jgi:hypothetical protein
MMRFLLGLALGAAALTATPAVAASAASPHLVTRSFRATAQEVDIHATGVPAAGSSALAAAALTASPGGDGALVTRLHFTGATGAPATYGLTVRTTAFFAHGTLALAFTGTLKLVGGRLQFAGRGRFTGGTGVFARARGTASFTGTAPTAAAGHVDTLHITGRLSY